jgi:hypothetical protein
MLQALYGKTDSFVRAVADFALANADQNERDHAVPRAAADSGRTQAQEGM